MTKLISLLNMFGANFYPIGKKTFPLTLIASEMPIGINFTSETSAQLKSACILAALNSFGTTNIYEKIPSRNHTENMIKNNKEAFKIIKNDYFKIFGKRVNKTLKLKFLTIQVLQLFYSLNFIERKIKS